MYFNVRDVKIWKNVCLELMKYSVFDMKSLCMFISKIYKEYEGI